MIKEFFDKIRGKTAVPAIFKTRKVQTSYDMLEQYLARPMPNGFHDIVHRTEQNTPGGIKFSDAPVARVKGQQIVLQTLEDFEGDLLKKFITFKEGTAGQSERLTHQQASEAFEKTPLPADHFSYHLNKRKPLQAQTDKGFQK